MLTKTNTDALCPSTTGNPIVVYLSKLKYRYYLWTVSLESHSRAGLAASRACASFYSTGSSSRLTIFSPTSLLDRTMQRNKNV